MALRLRLRHALRQPHALALPPRLHGPGNHHNEPGQGSSSRSNLSFLN
jgi:hypothetical protein